MCFPQAISPVASRCSCVFSSRTDFRVSSAVDAEARPVASGCTMAAETKALMITAFLTMRLRCSIKKNTR
ncbi:hypothetical protein [Actinomadura chibensis]|uniref:hypothetical protein n=1 Tax=Actinomadura chibensis TaxID=392828 RepID=UPI001C3F295A|nr:hypothetical protein [Actinomadura chibensis]